LRTGGRLSGAQYPDATTRQQNKHGNNPDLRRPRAASNHKSASMIIEFQ
jgi:hypothetical protein